MDDTIPERFLWITDREGKRVPAFIENRIGCLSWQGRTVNGYGKLGQEWVYQALYAHAHGKPAKGLDIHHISCDTLCGNVEHLHAIPRPLHKHIHHRLAQAGRLFWFDGTSAIRTLRAAGVATSVIARCFKVSITTVMLIVSGDRWSATLLVVRGMAGSKGVFQAISTFVGRVMRGG